MPGCRLARHLDLQTTYLNSSSYGQKFFPGSSRAASTFSPSPCHAIPYLCPASGPNPFATYSATIFILTPLCPSFPAIHRTFPKVELLSPSSHYVLSQHSPPHSSLSREAAMCQGTTCLYTDTDLSSMYAGLPLLHAAHLHTSASLTLP